jgi:hypothetical protein
MTTDEQVGIFYLIFSVVMLLTLAVVAVIPAGIAERKGHSFWGFYFFGFFFLPWALTTACLIEMKAGYVHQVRDSGNGNDKRIIAGIALGAILVASVVVALLTVGV